MAGATTIGLGLGVICLIVLWTITAFLWVLLSSSQTTLRVIVTCLALLLTLFLFIIPTSEDNGNRISLEPPKRSYELYDYMFIWRALLIILLFISITAAVAVYLTEFWSVKVHGSSPIPKRNRMQMHQSPFLTDEF